MCEQVFSCVWVTGFELGYLLMVRNGASIANPAARPRLPSARVPPAQRSLHFRVRTFASIGNETIDPLGQDG